jgi:uncharacterized protein YdeI (YjbR/CyaY-like superfamily)
MKELEHIFFSNRNAFRSWLETNHDKSPGIWMIFNKKHIKVECINYTDALEEALCFGWIDSLIKKTGDNQYVRKFTPRKNNAKWSEFNKKIVMDLAKEGRMTEAGLKTTSLFLKAGGNRFQEKEAGEKQEKELNIPGFILEEFSKNEPALANFNALARTYQRHYVLWITNAQREKTIRKRLKESTELLKENKKLGLK